MCDDKEMCVADAKNLISTGGRVDNSALNKSVRGSVTVGYYDPNHVPAVNLFASHNCTGGSKRLFTNPDPAERTVEYAMNRVHMIKAGSRGMFTGGSPARYAKSAMVPPGYSI